MTTAGGIFCGMIVGAFGLIDLFLISDFELKNGSPFTLKLISEPDGESVNTGCIENGANDGYCQPTVHPGDTIKYQFASSTSFTLEYQCYRATS